MMTERFDFAGAIQHLKTGSKVARKDWNGEGIFLYLVPANQYHAKTEIEKEVFGDMVSGMPYIAMVTVHGNASPWTASQTDLLAEDWFIVCD